MQAVFYCISVYRGCGEVGGGGGRDEKGRWGENEGLSLSTSYLGMLVTFEFIFL